MIVKHCFSSFFKRLVFAAILAAALDVNAGTFHALCARVLRADGAASAGVVVGDNNLTASGRPVDLQTIEPR